MWITNNTEWHNSHSDLSKYFIESLKQKVDYEESISNRHRTSNGYTLINEIASVCSLTLKRMKSIHRLRSLLNEAKCDKIKSSIINDYILLNHHNDIVTYYKKFDVNKIKDDLVGLNELLNIANIQIKRLESEYLSNIIEEFQAISFSSTTFVRDSEQIDNLIDCLLPYLIFKGYSSESISEIAKSYISKPSGLKSAERFLEFFTGKKFEFIFTIRSRKDSFEVKTIKNYLDNKKEKNEIINFSSIQKFSPDFEDSDNIEILEIERSTIDPHNYLRNLYEVCLKRHVISKDRLDLSDLNDFFDRVYWRYKKKPIKLQRSNFNIDPINVKKRKSTLMNTLIKVNKSFDSTFDNDSNIPPIKEISEPLYYYNLALGSKSIENSLMLLWTSLETLLPYRMGDNDISSVQYFVSKLLSIGVIGREIMSFATRYYETNWNKCLSSLNVNGNYIDYTSNGLKEWIMFLSATYQSADDPYETIKLISNLLCKEFCKLNDIFTGKNGYTVKYWIEKIESSKNSIFYQLDRIYLHRNQIVHSGKFINEYSNLWHHLEWYVGKLLAYSVISYLQLENKSEFNTKSIFYELEGYCDNLKNKLDSNSSKKICEVKNLYELILKHSWQFF